jgi:rhodanese-related sulfurtransferase
MFKFLRGLTVVFSLLMLPLAALASEESPMTVPGATTVSAEEAVALFDQGVPFIDVRSPSDWDAGRIPGAFHLDSNVDFTEANLAEIVGKGDTVVIYCNGADCMRSSEMAAVAVGWGYTDVHYFRDGFPAWDAAGFPIE